MHQEELNEDIRKYLSTMKKLLKSGCKLKLISKTKDKNFIFMYLYQITEEEVKKQLLSLKEEEFKEKVYSTHPEHLGEELYVWSPTRTFVAQDGSEVEEKLYVKTHIDENKRIVVTVSFHRYGDV